MKSSARHETVVAIVVGALVFGGIAYKLQSNREANTAYAAAEEIHGTIYVADWEPTEDGCVGAGRYSDLQSGAPVAVVSEGGATASRSILRSGKPAGDVCTFDFRLLGVNLTSPTQRIMYGNHGPSIVDTDEAMWGAAIHAE